MIVYSLVTGSDDSATYQKANIMTDTKYFDLVNEGGEGYSPEQPETDSRTTEEKIKWLEHDLECAENDDLTYKAKKIVEQIAALRDQLNN